MQRPADYTPPRNPAALKLARCWKVAPAVVFVVALLALAVDAEAINAEAQDAPVEKKTEQSAKVIDPKTSTKTRFTTKALRGQVVWMADALKKSFGVVTVTEARERVLALATTDGGIYPIMEDPRGRSFRRDERLRDIDLELIVRQYEGSPMLQVIRTHAVEGPDKYRLDYWCDVCSISMVELKPCDCCQAPTELRRRKVTTDQSLVP